MNAGAPPTALHIPSYDRDPIVYIRVTCSGEPMEDYSGSLCSLNLNSFSNHYSHTASFKSEMISDDLNEY